VLQEPGGQTVVVVPLLDRVVFGGIGEVLLAVGNQKLFQFCAMQIRKDGEEKVKGNEEERKGMVLEGTQKGDIGTIGGDTSKQRCMTTVSFEFIPPYVPG
jgi:hypothetical protein